jgi:hypothetical protein
MVSFSDEQEYQDLEQSSRKSTKVNDELKRKWLSLWCDDSHDFCRIEYGKGYYTCSLKSIAVSYTNIIL